jgi:isoamyl acetate esterase
VSSDSRIPTAYLIGDSIAGGYAAAVQAELAGEVSVEVRPENGEDSRRVLAQLDEWLAGRSYDVIHVNCGLHDLKRAHCSGELQVPLAEYEADLWQIVARLGLHTGRLIWGRITPVIDGQPVATKSFDRFNRDVAAYNKVADWVMAGCGVAINDLHRAIIEAGVADCVSEDGVHMTDQGYAILSRRVAAAIRKAMTTD